MSDLQHLFDLEQLRRLGQKYARAVDARDIDAVAALFHPDARIDGMRGSTSIAEWLDNMRNVPRAFEASMHVLGDPLIDLEPGSAIASIDTYAVVYQLREPGSDEPDLTLGIRYVDQVVRDEARWLSRHRASSMLWSR